MTPDDPPRRLPARHLLLVAVAVIGAACTPPEGGLDQGDVAGYWLLESGSVLGEPFPLVEDHRITLVLGADGAVRGRATCNSYASDFQLVAGIFELGAELAATTVVCEPEVMEAEEAFFRALPVLESARLDEARLVLESDDALLEFTPLDELDPSLLEGDWTVTGYGDGAISRETDGEPSLLFTPQEEVSGETGCRPFHGTYVVVGDEVFVTEIDVDGVCSGGRASQDAHLLEVLGSGFVVEGSGDSLNFVAQGGRLLAVTRRGPGPASASGSTAAMLGSVPIPRRASWPTRTIRHRT